MTESAPFEYIINFPADQVASNSDELLKGQCGFEKRNADHQGNGR
jgi:hypothetical protein